MKSCPTCNRTYPDDTLAFCLVDGSVLSAPYDPEQTQRIPQPRTTDAAPTEVLANTPKARSAPPQSTIYAPAPQVPPLGSVRPGVERVDSAKRSVFPWLLISGAILLVGIFGVWMVFSRLLTISPTSSTNRPSSPSLQGSSAANSMCGLTVSAVIFEKWTAMGGETGKLGCPINQETEAPPSPQGSTGRWIQFAKGDGGYLIAYTEPPNDGIHVKPAPLVGHAFEVSGCMFKLYASLGGTKSWLGFPIHDGYETAPGARQEFEGGYIVWDAKTYNCQAHKN